MNFIEEKILEKIKKNPNYVPTFRFPPENSGTLHLGHAKAIVLNFGLAEKFNSSCNLRMDDTNPLNESEEFSKSIIEDVGWLGYKWNKDVKYTSEYFDKIKECAKYLILMGNAYIDFSTSKEIAEMKGTPTKPGTNSFYRDSNVEGNIIFFEKMLSGETTDGVLRAKIDMSSDNMIMRDPILFRCIEGYGASPMYDFAHPLSDKFENITDSLCTLEFEVHRPLYNWVIDKCSVATDNMGHVVIPEQTEFNRLNIDYTILSKRNLKYLVENNIVSGWDDPRMPTIKGLRRRGYTPNSIKTFCEKAGWTKHEVVVEHKLLESCLREELNKTSLRYMGVIDPIKLTITNWDKDVEWVSIENNPENEDDGKRTVAFSKNLWIEKEDFRESANRKYFRLKIGHEVRLKGGYVVKANECIKDEDGNVIEVLCTYDPLTKSGMGITMDRKVKGTIHWVSRDHAVDMEVREYSNLFDDKKPDIENNINADSLTIKNGYTELDCLNLRFENIGDKINYPIQFMRKGYYILDKDSNNDKLIFNRSVTLKETWNNSK